MNVDKIQHTLPATQKEYNGHIKQVKTDSTVDFKQDTTQHELEIDYKKIQSTVEKLNQFNDPEKTNLKFVYHEDLHEYYVTVVNPITDEVVREIPPKKLLDMFAAMEDYMGLLIDEKL